MILTLELGVIGYCNLVKQFLIPWYLYPSTLKEIKLLKLDYERKEV